jgi:hypothetical protein
LRQLTGYSSNSFQVPQNFVLQGEDLYKHAFNLAYNALSWHLVGQVTVFGISRAKEDVATPLLEDIWSKQACFAFKALIARPPRLYPYPFVQKVYKTFIKCYLYRPSWVSRTKCMLAARSITEVQMPEEHGKKIVHQKQSSNHCLLTYLFIPIQASAAVSRTSSH